jgi:hypothetical protein
MAVAENTADWAPNMPFLTDPPLHGTSAQIRARVSMPGSDFPYALPHLYT